MGKLNVYLMILGIALILFHFAGLIVQTPTHFLMQIILNPSSLASSSLWVIVAAIFVAATAIGIIIGTLTHTTPDWILIASLCAATLFLGLDMVALWSSVSSTAGTFLATLIISPFIVLWLFTMVEWWRGRD